MGIHGGWSKWKWTSNVRKLAAKENECDQENAIIRLPYTKDSSA